MKITRIEIRRVPPSWVWLLIHTDDGRVGIGEPYLEGHAHSVIAEVERLEPLLIGADPMRREHLWEEMYRAGVGYRGGPITMSAISGIDMALWDIAGKALDAPVHQLLGGAVRDRVRMYRATSFRPPYTVEPGLPYRAAPPSAASVPDEPSAWAAAARQSVDWGFNALKLHFSLGSLESTKRIDAVVERFAAVRAEVGDDFDLAVDIHDPHHRLAIQLIQALEPLRPMFVEEPVPQEQIGAIDHVAQHTSAALAAGERWMGRWPFFEALKNRSLSIVQPDLAHAGGITECRKIAALAQAVDASVALHCPLSPIALAASIQLDAALPNFLIQEHNEILDSRTADGRTLIGQGYLKEPFELGVDGCVAVPMGAGLGIELDLDGLEEVSRHPWSTQRG